VATFTFAKYAAGSTAVASAAWPPVHAGTVLAAVSTEQGSGGAHVPRLPSAFAHERFMA
jgi:hypothetical protein